MEQNAKPTESTSKRKVSKAREKQGQLTAVLKLCPVREGIMVLTVLVIAVLRALRGNSALMRHLSENYVQPIHRRLAILTDAVPFSIAELLILIG